MDLILGCPGDEANFGLQLCGTVAFSVFVSCVWADNMGGRKVSSGVWVV